MFCRLMCLVVLGCCCEAMGQIAPIGNCELDRWTGLPVEPDEYQPCFCFNYSGTLSDCCEPSSPSYDPAACNDVDGDGTPNGSDPDVDGDGIPNGSDPDVDGDGIPNGMDPDVDGDGVQNGQDPDVDGDGFNNGDDLDVDGDGLDNGHDPDIDGDALPNQVDPDMDGDGLDNGLDPDVDGDGVDNGADPDIDSSDGTNCNDGDMDQDGTNNSGDSDIDGDGVANGSDASPCGVTSCPSLPECADQTGGGGGGGGTGGGGGGTGGGGTGEDCCDELLSALGLLLLRLDSIGVTLGEIRGDINSLQSVASGQLAVLNNIAAELVGMRAVLVDFRDGVFTQLSTVNLRVLNIAMWVESIEAVVTSDVPEIAASLRQLVSVFDPGDSGPVPSPLPHPLPGTALPALTVLPASPQAEYGAVSLERTVALGRIAEYRASFPHFAEWVTPAPGSGTGGSGGVVMPSVSGAPVWHFSTPAVSLAGFSAHGYDLALDWAFWGPFRGVFFVIVKVALAIWSATLIWGETRRS